MQRKTVKHIITHNPSAFSKAILRFYCLIVHDQLYNLIFKSARFMAN